ncbi:hypothetical protein AV530_005091 [Patagioenas fasciata monilis]|uniref:Uncharacterized protein n=1 Tax=Patagioenas fasciata monilis TaxID=372326 RepID=A0A1V4K4A8_PATFA|nr:hypothetical protein AV530_005091 [Patagioenas fasciata monilis]
MTASSLFFLVQKNTLNKDLALRRACEINTTRFKELSRLNTSRQALFNPKSARSPGTGMCIHTGLAHSHLARAAGCSVTDPPCGAVGPPSPHATTIGGTGTFRGWSKLDINIDGSQLGNYVTPQLFNLYQKQLNLLIQQI